MLFFRLLKKAMSGSARVVEMYSTRFSSLGVPLVAGLWMGGDRPIIVLFSLLAGVTLLLALRHLHFSLRDATGLDV